MKQRLLASGVLSSVGAVGAFFFGRLAVSLTSELIASSAWHASSFDAGAAILVLVIAAAVSAWYALSGLLTAIVLGGHLNPEAVRGFLAPFTARLLRHASAATLTLAVGSGVPLVGVVASATPGQEMPPPPSAFFVTSDVLPPISGAEGATPEPPDALDAEHATATYTVQRGDCLWRIVQRERHTATHAETAELVREIVELNPAITDPNLIYPGQTLTLGKDRS